MMRGIFSLITFISIVLFPWPMSVFLALAISLFEPLVPLAAGIFADTLYYTPQSGILPLFTLYGAAVTALAFFVRSRLRTGPVRDL